MPSDHYVICTHGYTVNRMASLKYAVMFREMGYHVVVYDDRGHGESEGKYIGMGWHDRKDVCSGQSF